MQRKNSKMKLFENKNQELNLDLWKKNISKSLP